MEEDKYLKSVFIEVTSRSRGRLRRIWLEDVAEDLREVKTRN